MALHSASLRNRGLRQLENDLLLWFLCNYALGLAEQVHANFVDQSEVKRRKGESIYHPTQQ